jgi:signal transduction histidine kinase
VSIRAALRPTLRLRLTLLYGGLFLLAGAVLLVVNYLLVRRSIDVRPAVLRERIELRIGHSLFSFQAPPLSEYRRLEHLLQQAASEMRAETLHTLVVQSAIAFAAMAVVCVGLGWVVAARALRPLQRITGTARRLSEETLHERIALEGPRDELKELADTFDEMLQRLDTAFESQRRFVANASHELRTPLSIIRAELDVTMSSEDPSVEELVAMANAVRQASGRCEQLIDSLLTLARSEGATPGGEAVDVSAVADTVLAGFGAEASARSVVLEGTLGPAYVRGDAVLLERLLENLVENAIRYNRPGGRVEVRVGASGGRVALVVHNDGDRIPPGEVGSLFEPFRRLGPDRTGAGRGFGLGLAIVRAVATAHGGAVTATARRDGGLEVSVDLPAVEAPRTPAPVGLPASTAERR